MSEALDAFFAARSPELARDPYPLLGEVREQAAAIWHGGSVLVGRHADVRRLCSDLRGFKRTHYDEGSFAAAIQARVPPEDRALYDEVSAFERLFLSRLHGEAHARLRALTHRAFTPRMVAGLDDYANEALDELLAPMAAAGTCDLVDGLSFRLPLLVIARMLGVPAKDADTIHRWTLPMAAFMDRQDLSWLRPWHAALQEFRAYVHELVERLRGAPPETSLLAALLAAGEGAIAEDELVATCVILLFAGHETTTNLISAGTWRLLRDRGQWDALCADPSLAADAVEEMLRCDPPVQFTHRIPIEDVDVDGERVPAGTTLVLLIAAANRDPRVWEEPDRFDLRRARRPHLSFAHGPVFCLGAALARMEARVVFAALAERHPGLRPAGEPQWAANAQLRGPSRLPVSL